MANLVVHFEIHASEPQKLIDFYSKLLGWQFQDYGGGDQPYWVIDTGEGAIGNAAGEKGLGINGGLTQRNGPRPETGAPVNGANIVVGVDDVDGLMQRGIELGRPRRCRQPTGRASAAADTCSIRTATSSASSRRSSPTAQLRWAPAPRPEPTRADLSGRAQGSTPEGGTS
jgi:predicted enzyme related to lactoylglutathione lyase